MYFINVFIFIGIVASSVSGSLTAIEKRLDLFGVIFVALITALGGGIIRDILIGNTPPVAFIKPIYFIVSFVISVLTCLFYKKLSKLKNVILLSDAIGLGVFTAIGSETAITHNMNQPFIVVSMGFITGIFGGILRDVFVKDIPFVFRKEIYAIASILGAVCFYYAYNNVSQVLALYICLGITFLLRVLSVIFNINAPVIKPEKNTVSNT